MNPFYLDKLTKRYTGEGNHDPGAFEELRRRYRQYKATTLMDLAAVASTLAIDTVETRELNPLALKAIHDTNPNFDPSATYTDEQWMGIVNSAKGKYFEYEVVDRLNRGETVGDVSLPDQYHAEVADSMNQPGWDIRILDEHDKIDQYLQLKATDNIDYVRDALERYPDITILTTDEVANHLPHDHMVLDSDISERDIQSAIGTTLDDSQSGFIDHFWDSFHPIIPLMLIAGTTGYHVVVGKQAIRSAAEVARARVARALTAAGVGAVFKALGAGLYSIPAALFAGWIFDRSQNIDDLIKATRKQNQLLLTRTTHYRTLLGEST